jgi:rhodanese-related sulfurtransferase
MNEERETRNEERKTTAMSRFLGHPSSFIVLLVVALAGCKTVGVSMTPGGYAEVSPQIANEMILDSRQVVILDVRSEDAFHGPSGHIAAALNAPFETIERQLPELLPYQNQTVVVYGEGDPDGALAAKLLIIAGFRNVVHVRGGLREWIERGYRTVNAQ